MTQIYGHEAFLDGFLKPLNTGTLPHAWLLRGPQGIGKCTLAKKIASLLISHPNPPYPSGLPEGTEVNQETHPDFLLIHKDMPSESTTAKTVITIDAVRLVSHFTQQTSQTGGWKVVIVDAVDDMNEKATNALLKSLEEPSEKTIFFLISHQRAVLPTIRSRCQDVTLSPLSDETLSAFLAENYPEIPPEDKTLYQRLAEGRLGTLQTLLEHQGILLLNQIIQAVHEVLTDTAPYSNAYTLSEAIPKEGEEAYTLFHYLLTWYMHHLSYAVATQNFSHALTESDGKVLAALQGTSLDAWLNAQTQLIQSLDREKTLKTDRKQAILGAFIALEAAS